MQFNRSNPNPGVLFPWPEGKGGITLRPLTLEKRQEIDKETVTTTKIYQDGLVYTDREPDENKRFEMINDYCIQGWSGIVDETGADIPCTLENKLLVLRQDPRAAQFITDCMIKLNEIETKRREKERKNLSKS
jgi:hypothetical protein